MKPFDPRVHADIAVTQLLYQELLDVDRTGDLLVVSNWIAPCDVDGFQRGGDEMCVVPEINMCECSAVMGHMMKVMQLKFDSIFWLSLSGATNCAFYEIHGVMLAMLVLLAVARGVFIAVEAQDELPSAMKCVLASINCESYTVSVSTA